MRHKFSFIIFMGLTFIAALFRCQSSHEPTEPSALYDRLEKEVLFKQTQRWLLRVSDSGTVGQYQLNFSDTLKALFEKKDGLVDWAAQILNPKNLAKLESFIGLAAKHGLEQWYYHGPAIKRLGKHLKDKTWDTASKIQYDSLGLLLLLTADGAMGMYHDLSRGRVDPKWLDHIDVLPRRSCGNLKGLITEDTLFAGLQNSIPLFEPYYSLRREYERVNLMDKKLLGGQLEWTKTMSKKEGMPLLFIRRLGRKLRLHGALALPDSLLDKKTTYDAELQNAVSFFQQRIGLEIKDGLNKETIDQLNVTQDEMLLSLRANLDRWRRIGPIAERSRIWVNIAENKVYAWQLDTLEVEMKVCSGKNRDETYYKKLKASQKDPELTAPDNLETPLMKAKLTHMVTSPVWHVPRNIMTKELLPAIKKNPAYLADNNYKLYNNKGEELNPFDIDWSKVTKENWRFRVEQGSGDDNALGKVVLQFPNAYSIYMHDTPSKYAFNLGFRHVSHGCVRMEHPLEMVSFLTSFNPKDNYDDMLINMGMAPERDEEKIEKYKEDMKDSAKAEKLKPRPNLYHKVYEPIPVYLVYFTCAKTAFGGIIYTGDGYKRDAKMIECMQRAKKPNIANKNKTQSAELFSP